MKISPSEFKLNIENYQMQFMSRLYDSGFNLKVPRVNGKTVSFSKDDIKYGYINSSTKSRGLIGFTFPNGNNKSPDEKAVSTKQWFENKYNCNSTDYVVHSKYADTEHYLIIKNLSLAEKIFNLEEQFPEKEVLDINFQEEIDKSLENHESRADRLKCALEKPTKSTATQTVFKRNPDVVAEVLHRENGICESCLSPAPFIRVSNNTPYLEVHHKVSLAKDGLDKVENAEALCPNCHKQKHFGPNHC